VGNTLGGASPLILTTKENDMRECSKCKQAKELDQFSKSTTNKWCKACANAYHKDRRSKDPEFNAYKNQNKKDRRKEIRAKVTEYLKSHPCVDCSESDYVVLQFDHLRDKKFVISDAITKCYSMEKIFQEIEKCEVRCANCHIRKTAKDFKWYE
jgi:dsDNA-specific endonuclease/ATPase MutS2